MLRRISTCWLALLFAALPCRAELTADSDGEYSYLALKGVNRVALEFRDQSPPPQPRYYQLDALRAELETQLAQGGISVVPPAQANSERDTALLLINSTILQPEYRFYSYSLTLRLKQKLPLTSSGYIAETVWSKGSSGTVDNSQINARLRLESAQLIAQFLREHAAQN